MGISGLNDSCLVYCLFYLKCCPGFTGANKMEFTIKENLNLYFALPLATAIPFCKPAKQYNFKRENWILLALPLTKWLTILQAESFITGA